jgi:hypothetical protein
MATTLGLSDEDVLSSDFLNTFSGTSIYPNTTLPCVMLDINLGWAGQLGDGRYNLTEVVHEDKTYTLKVLGLHHILELRMVCGIALVQRIFMCRSHALFGVTTRCR